MTLILLSVGYFVLYWILILVIPEERAADSPFVDWWVSAFGTSSLSPFMMAVLLMAFSLAPLIASLLVL